MPRPNDYTLRDNAALQDADNFLVDTPSGVFRTRMQDISAKTSVDILPLNFAEVAEGGVPIITSGDVLTFLTVTGSCGFFASTVTNVPTVSNDWMITCVGGGDGANRSQFFARASGSVNTYIGYKSGASTITWSQIYTADNLPMYQLTYDTTTASAANMYVGTDGTFVRSTSSEKFKSDIVSLESDDAKRVIENVTPIKYKSKSKVDNPDWSYYGISAESLAEIEPRLVQWGYWPEDYTTKNGERSLKKTAKLTPVGVQYDRFVPILLKVMQEDRKRLSDLESRLEKLEAKL